MKTVNREQKPTKLILNTIKSVEKANKTSQTSSIKTKKKLSKLEPQNPRITYSQSSQFLSFRQDCP